MSIQKGTMHQPDEEETAHLIPSKPPPSIRYSAGGHRFIDENDDGIQHHSNGSFFGTTFNIMTCVIGSGILLLPSAFEECGVALAAILLAGLTLVSIYTINLLIKCSEVSGSKTYQEVAFTAYGLPGTRLAKFFLFLNLFGTLSAYCKIMGDLAYPVAEYALHDHWYTDARTLSAALLVFIVLPLAFFSKIHQLEKTSILAILSVLVVLFLVVFRSIQHLVHNGTGSVHIFRFENIKGIARSVPLFAFAAGCQTQIIPIFNELKPALRERNAIKPIVYLSNANCFAVYVIIAVFGYLQFGGETCDNIVSNYADSDIIAIIGRVSMAAHVALAFPLQLWPCRNILDSFFFDPNDNRFQTLRHTGETIFLLVSSYGLSITTKKIDVIFGFTGFTGDITTIVNFVLPCLFFLKLAERITITKKIACWAVIILGIAVGLLSLGIQIWDLADKPDTKPCKPSN
ncbi:putative sodium-coupled neutral amino acid transporter 10-like [Planoprotostelium fungivorum]|uniref:Putative sodium-coupled neutral amino acid transporter 10-like n=1 Tax=Planoprotostelium fungivorum TaxID=1890364 RepID=A0A2P6NYX9_9EUKA|nr:putative sodium-coupled neutral amino acid transporter 10-like [Planoprotostelium fungivorum]